VVAFALIAPTGGAIDMQPGRDHWCELVPLDPEHPLEDFDLFQSFAVATRRAEALMKRGLEANPRSGMLAFEAGFLHYVRPGGAIDVLVGIAIEKKILGVVHECLRKTEALPHALGICPDLAILRVGDADPRQ